VCNSLYAMLNLATNRDMVGKNQ